MSVLATDPTFWSVTEMTAPEYNKADREKRIMRDGRMVRVKHPQTGHRGNYDDPKRYNGLGTRWTMVVKTNGNVVAYVLTNGAADFNNRSPYALDRLAKARAFGWFETNKCPCALHQAGELSRNAFVDKSLIGAAPCPPKSYSYDDPCPHVVAEIAARVRANNALEAERAAKSEDKHLAAQKAQTDALVAATHDQTRSLIETLATILAGNQSNAASPAIPQDLIDALKAIASKGKKGASE